MNSRYFFKLFSVEKRKYLSSILALSIEYEYGMQIFLCVKSLTINQVFSEGRINVIKTGKAESFVSIFNSFLPLKAIYETLIEVEVVHKNDPTLIILKWYETFF